MIASESHHRVFLIAKSGASVPVRVHVDKRARRVSVRIDPHAREAVATAPALRHALDAISFASERVDWIAERLGALPRPVQLRPGAYIPLRGVIHRLRHVETGRTVRLDKAGPTPVLLIPGPREVFEDKTRAFFRSAARADFAERVAVHAATLKVTPRSISIKDTRSRWGSCSSEGRLNFSWRLVCAPPFALDYVAAHEVAHLREMNHSSRFWRQVARAMPEWVDARKWLQERGSALHAIGE
ncbi:MAG: SprT family zinc-dependent metalloprotease [Alphaproteobacteria bacterium]|nr:SprT family zinc-dependent metalloprotease [Alphaproteobacteria bacterium]